MRVSKLFVDWHNGAREGKATEGRDGGKERKQYEGIKNPNERTKAMVIHTSS
jgi:hypothetical protein